MRRALRFLILTLFTACGSEDAPPNGAEPVDPRDSGLQTCIDADGDGYGRHCSNGADCNDDDDSVFDDCLCSAIAEGCACDGDLPPVECDLAKTQVSPDNLLCKTGMRYCRDGKWTACVGVAAISD